MSNHTPGPWKWVWVNDEVGGIQILATPYRIIADLTHEGPLEDNAALIAAAPELLAACEATESFLTMMYKAKLDLRWNEDGLGDQMETLYNEVKRKVAKAKGDA